MNSVSIGELRQNPAGAIEKVEAGHAVEITRYRKVIAQIVPVQKGYRPPTGSELMRQIPTLRQLANPEWKTDITAARVHDDAAWRDPWGES